MNFCRSLRCWSAGEYVQGVVQTAPNCQINYCVSLDGQGLSGRSLVGSLHTTGPALPSRRDRLSPRSSLSLPVPGCRDLTLPPRQISLTPQGQASMEPLISGHNTNMHQTSTPLGTHTPQHHLQRIGFLLTGGDRGKGHGGVETEGG